MSDLKLGLAGIHFWRRLTRFVILQYCDSSDLACFFYYGKEIGLIFVLALLCDAVFLILSETGLPKNYLIIPYGGRLLFPKGF